MTAEEAADRPPASPRKRGRPAGAAETQRLNVMMASTAMAALRELAAARGVSLTEMIRRSIHLMRFVDKAVRDGKQVHVRDPETGDVQTVEFL